MSSILGISAFYHDSAACLLINGEIIAAAQEERFTRIKNDSSLPLNSIKFIWSPDEEQWVKNYEEVKLLFTKEGHLFSINDSRIRTWCSNQRQNYKKGILSKTKIKLLNDIKFSLSFDEDQWYDKYQKLKERYPINY